MGKELEPWRRQQEMPPNSMPSALNSFLGICDAPAAFSGLTGSHARVLTTADVGTHHGRKP